MSQEEARGSCPTAAGNKIAVHQIDAWAAVWSTTRRQLWRWIKVGREKDDPCPLQDPEAMPDWWARRMTWSVPSKIWAVARAGGGDKTKKNLIGISVSNISPPVTPIDINEFDVSAGEAVRQWRRIVGALFTQVQKAYLAGDPVDHIQSRLNKASEQLRKLEKDEREDKLSTGEYISKEENERACVAGAAMLKQMRESMVRRVLELCPWLTPDQREKIAAAIERVRSQEDRIFQRTPLLKSNDDFLAELVA